MSIISYLVTTAALITIFLEIENKILDISDSEKHYDTKINEINGKLITTLEFNKFSSDIFVAKIKQKD